MQLATGMDLKGILKAIKLNEGTISTILGVIVVLAVVFLVINYFRGLRTNLNQQVTSTSTESLPGGQHTVALGETLWSIAEKYYNSGYNWTDIEKENNLTSPNSIEVGQTLNIPKIESKQTTVAQATQASPQPTPAPSPTAPPQLAKPALTADSEYTVVRGDHLWGIAVRTYGDGYQWVKIWRANKFIKNPNLIYPDQKITLPK